MIQIGHGLRTEHGQCKNEKTKETVYITYTCRPLERGFIYRLPKAH